jgi:hypothetical protein
MKPVLVQLQPEHLQAAVYRPDHAQYVLALGEWNANIERGMVLGGGVALVLGEEVLAMSGLSLLWAGVGQLWMRTCLNAHKYPVAIVKSTRRYLAGLESTLGLRRIQATVRADSVINRRFVEFLGFRTEGTMRGFGPDGSDYILYARVEE